MQMEEKMKFTEADGLKRLAFFGIAVSTVATLTAIIAVPMLYNYTQYVQSSLQDDVEFCKHRADGLWDEFHRVEVTIKAQAVQMWGEVAVVAELAMQDHLDRRVQTEILAAMVKQAIREVQEPMRRRMPHLLKENRASIVPPVDHQASQEREAKMLSLLDQDPLDHRPPGAPGEVQDLPGTPGPAGAPGPMGPMVGALFSIN
ncbi:hypothetical protein WR25_24869 [Diploscapter pachys]|uniref:Nematode cuticle collagen N-terminal domain-containing protein n=1 Tax=Diploscapter pachys TaxID=2018661 RepID=A0A2A2L491_9BILA|nr:hypothetical protein WR25_24869 [Diploscapter pachys]